MIPVPVRRIAREHRSDHQRPRHADHPHHVRQHAVMSPLVQRLFPRLRKAVIDRPRPVLLHAVIPPGLQQFLRPDQPHRVVRVRRHLVLPALAPVQRQLNGACAHAARLPDQHPAVLVVRMRHHQRQARARADLPQQSRHPRRAAVRRNRLRISFRRQPVHGDTENQRRERGAHGNKTGLAD